MRSSLFAVLLALSAAFVPRPAAALDPYVTVTNCEQVEVGGQSATRLTLSILAKSGVVYSVAVLPAFGPMYPDTCTVIDEVAPPGWVVHRQDDGVVAFDAGAAGPIQPNQSLGGFQLTLSKDSCCKAFIFQGVTLLDTPSTAVCFENCLATPASKASWGRLKAAYR